MEEENNLNIDEEPEADLDIEAPTPQQNQESQTAQEFFELEHRDVKLRLGSHTFDVNELASLGLGIIKELKKEGGQNGKPSYT